MKDEEFINKGLICKYCGETTELVSSIEIYKTIDFGKIYLCRKCNAYVGCHKGTTESMGSVANAEERKLRHIAHHWFDALWKNKFKKSRYNAYSWLSLRMNLNKNITHMGLFDKEDCLKVIKICSDYIRARNEELWDKLNKDSEKL